LKSRPLNQLYSIIALVKEIKDYPHRDTNDGKMILVKIVDESKEKFDLVI
jgi:hypothetical protein